MVNGFLFLSLSDDAALDPVAVLSVMELHEIRLVLAGSESGESRISELEGRGLSQTKISSKTTNLAGNSLHTIFASDN